MKERIAAASRDVQESLKVLEERKETLDKARKELRDAGAEAENRDALESAATAALKAFDEAEARVKEDIRSVKEFETLAQAREVSGVPATTDDEPENTRHANPKGGLDQPRGLTYRPDGPHSFFADQAKALGGDFEAASRLAQHNRETKEYRKSESEMAERKAIERGEFKPGITQRDVTSSDPGAGGFIPPVYLADMWVAFPRGKRPFADRCRTVPLPPDGLVLTIPKMQSGATVAARATEGAAVSETDADAQTVTANVRTIAGQNDLSIEAAERTLPGWDQVIMQDLVAAYDEYLDTQLIAGTGASGQHLGIRAVSGVNTVSYTDASPTAAELLPKLFDGLQKIETSKVGEGDLIIFHPRRSYWMASNLSSTFPLFQLGSLVQAIGRQSGGAVQDVAGIESIRDVNIATAYGAGTNEDEIYEVVSSQMFLAEGELRTRALAEVLSGTLQIRLQVYAYSAFIPHRLPTAITVISGTGLVTPTF